jgi:hypothetical protein
MINPNLRPYSKFMAYSRSNNAVNEQQNHVGLATIDGTKFKLTAPKVWNSFRGSAVEIKRITEPSVTELASLRRPPDTDYLNLKGDSNYPHSLTQRIWAYSDVFDVGTRRQLEEDAICFIRDVFKLPNERLTED